MCRSIKYPYYYYYYYFLRPPTLLEIPIPYRTPTPQQIPIPSVGGVWIFSGTAQCTVLVIIR